MRLAFSIAYHPQTDRQIKRVNQVIEDMLRACCLDQGVCWTDVLPLIMFTYNNSY